MNGFSRKVVAFSLLFFMIVQFYTGVVQIVGTFRPSGMVRSLKLMSSRSMNSADQFVIGDGLKVVAESDAATACTLRVYSNSSLVFESEGEFKKSVAELTVGLCPPKFAVGSYVAVLDAHVYNFPIPGVSFSDSDSVQFAVVAVETCINVVASYDQSFRSLSMVANLTDQNGYPVAGESVDFKLSFADRQRLTNGWIPLGSATTDGTGMAALKLAFNMHDGNYEVSACHEANLNFGASENISDVQVVEGGSLGEYVAWSPLASEATLPLGISGNLTFTVSNSTPYACLPMTITSSFVTAVPLDNWVYMFYFLVNGSGLRIVGSSEALLSSQGGPSYEYDASLMWEPTVVGPQEIIIGVANGTILEMINASDGMGLLCTTQAFINVQRCPSSMILQQSEAACGSNLVVRSGFFKPRPYGEGLTGFSVATALAPDMSYGGINYAVDDPVVAVPIRLYVNGTVESANSTDNDGLAEFSLPLDSVGSYFTLNITDVADDPGMLCESNAVSRTVNFTTVSICDVGTGGSDACKLNLTVRNCKQETSELYVETNNSIEADASLFGVPIQNASTSFAIESSILRCGTSSGSASIPSNADYVRVAEVNRVLLPREGLKVRFNTGENVSVNSQGCARIPQGATNLTVLVDPLVGDITGDGVVNILDAIALGNAFGSTSGSYNWNPRADLNKDGVINILDAILLGKNFLATATVDGVLEFFATTPEEKAPTNELGVATTTWSPEENGTYLVRAALPSNFNVTVDFWSGVTQVDASLSLVDCVSVVKRPVNLAILPNQFHVEPLQTTADAYVSAAPGARAKNYGSLPDLMVGWDGHYDCMSLVRFDVSSIPSNAYIVSARLNLYGNCLVYGADISCGVYRVLSPWDELNVTFANKPTCENNASCTFECVQSLVDKWLFLDVTDDVRMWHDGSASNYGWLLGEMNQGSFELDLNSRQAPSDHPGLEVSYLLPGSSIVASAYDGVTQNPFSALPVSFSVDGSQVGSSVTNSSGIASSDSWPCWANNAYNVTVSSSGNATCEDGYASSVLDLRFPSNLTASFPNPRGVIAGLRYDYTFRLASSALFGLQGMPVKFAVNGICLNGTLYAFNTVFATDPDGYAVLTWPAPSGTYSINATFDGSDYYQPCSAIAAVNASVTPLAVSFDVSQHEFVTGTNLVLSATIIDISTNLTVSGPSSITVEFLSVSSDGTTTSLHNVNTASGVATYRFGYPSDGKAYAFMARVVPAAGSIQQGIVCNPLQLTVSKPATLLLNVSRDWLSGNHTIEGWLLNATSGISGKQVKITVNDTHYLSSVTNASGYFSLSLRLQLVNGNATTYVITASFEDNSTAPINATAWATTLDGEQYPACTTMQYGYKSAFNTTTLTVLPESTEVLAMRASPDEMQKEAQDKGWLSVYSEWSWWYPWYRLHVKINLDPTIDVGFNPILPGGETCHFDSLGVFANTVEQVWESMVFDFAGLLVGYVAAKIASATLVWIAIEFMKNFAQGVFLGLAWGQRDTVLAISLASFLMGLVACGGSVSEQFAKGLESLIWAGTMSAIYKSMGDMITIVSSVSFFHTWVDVAEIVMDFAWGAFALAHYLGYM